MVPAVAVGEADDQGLVPRIGLALFPAPVRPVDVKAGGVHVKSPHGKGKGSAGRFSHLHEQLGDPGRVQAVQHPAHAVVVQKFGGDAGPQEQLGGLALEEVAEEVEGRGDEAQGVQYGGLEGHASGDLFARPWAHELVYGLYQSYLIHDAGHQAQVAQVVHL